MSKPNRYAIIGSGAAGTEAAIQLRHLDPESEITIVTVSKLQFVSRYELPRVFEGVSDWRDLLVHGPEFYEDNRITVRRNTWVASVNPKEKKLNFRHKEEMAYDKLLVASGGGGYMPENLREFSGFMNPFSTFENAVRLRDSLGEKGKVAMLGGDMVGLDLARNLSTAGHEVTLYASEQLFWPHEISKEDLAPYVKALEAMGVNVVFDRKPVAVQDVHATNSKSPYKRRLVFEKGKSELVNVVMPFYGLMPSLDFMVGTGVDIERGLLVNRHLKTTNDRIWAAGDVCQIWSPEENRYSFYYGWNNVKKMGHMAAHNMTGESQEIKTSQTNNLEITKKGELHSPYWEYD
jgi:NAD(P)H-nitrite reductase large subunit